MKSILKKRCARTLPTGLARNAFSLELCLSGLTKTDLLRGDKSVFEDLGFRIEGLGKAEILADFFD